MRKFTIFTILLTIVVIVVMGQILVDEYLPNLGKDASGELSVLLPDSLKVDREGTPLFFGADLVRPEEEDISVDDDFDSHFSPESTSSPSSEPSDFEDLSYAANVQGSSPVGSVLLREEQIKSAGFVGGYIEPEDHEGLLFKTVAVDDLDDVKMDKFAIRTEDQFLAKVYVFRVGISTNVRDVYQLLKSKASQGVGVQINETNDFGVSSFYKNDSRRKGVAFLTVRIGGLIYSFSYPHEYHSQIKNLIQLLEWEIG